MENDEEVTRLVEDAFDHCFTTILLLENLAAHNPDALAALQKMGKSEDWWKEDLASMKEGFYEHGYGLDDYMGRVIGEYKEQDLSREKVKTLLSRYYVFNDENAESYLRKYWD